MVSLVSALFVVSDDSFLAKSWSSEGHCSHRLYGTGSFLVRMPLKVMQYANDIS